MSKIKVKEQEFKRIDGKRFEIWARYTTKAEAQAERKRAAQVVRHARELRESGHLARVVKAKGGVSHIYWCPRFGRQGGR